MSDYLHIEYNESKRPKTDYPAKLAKHLFDKYNLVPNQDFLEVGSGRAELLLEFNRLGLRTWAIDDAPSSVEHAKLANSEIELHTFVDKSTFRPFDGRKFDIIFSKSFVEHISDPLGFSQACFDLLKPGGKLITLTPDWESNVSIFFDDLTHIKPFTTEAMSQFLEYGNYSEIEVERFMQLPSTWGSRVMHYLARLTSIISPPRAKNKWIRWSREMMIAGVGVKPRNV